MRLAIAALSAFILASCGHVIPARLTADARDFDFSRQHACTDPDPDASRVEVRYLGSGAVWIAWRGEAILLGASFSNPSLLRAAAGRMKYDDRRIDEALAPVERRNVPLKAILAGHSHYDHIGDLPRIVTRPGFDDARVYLNASGIRMAHGEPDLLARVAEIRDDDTIAVSERIHIRPIAAGHAPQICPLRIWPCVYGGGAVTEDWSTPWTTRFLQAFRGGRTYAFVIELRDEEGTTRYRIFYNDAAGRVPAAANPGHVDLAILCIAQWNWACGYPADLLAALAPKHVIVSHWEDFFRCRGKPQRFVPLMSNDGAAAFLDVIERAQGDAAGPANEACGARARSNRWTMPVVGASMQFTPR